MSKPFLSVIIPCYNDGRYKDGVYLDRLLTSMTNQGMKREEVEVIIADDCSPEPFFDKYEKKFGDKFIMKYVKTDDNFAPGNTRAKGVEIATGEWMAFADHDDMYYPQAFTAVRNAIRERNEKYFIFTDFTGVTPEGEVTKAYKCVLNWCHGKFYNRKNLWDKFGIHFIHDLASHEDIAICTQVACAFTQLQQELTYLAVASYAWTDNPQSVSHAKYYVEGSDGPRYFLEVFFKDYLTATGYIYLDEFAQHKISLKYAVTRCIDITVYCYIYMQGFQFKRKDFLKENLFHSGEFLNRIKETFNLTNEQIYDAVAEDNAAIYRKIRPLADPGAGAYIPQQSFMEWIELVDQAYIDAEEHPNR